MAASLNLCHRTLQAISSLPGARGVILNNHVQSASQMRRQIETLGPLFEFIDILDVKNRLSQKQTRPFCVMTFDDGKKINALETAPECKRLGVPASFYLITSVIGTDRVLWFDRWKQLSAAVPDLPAELHLSTLKQLPRQDAEERVEQACLKHGVDADSANPLVGYMDWDDAKALKQQGFTLGAHTVHHAIVTQEDAETARQEVTESIQELTTRLGTPCRSFAFPNGNWTPELASTAKDAGADVILTTDPTWVGPANTGPVLPRVYMKESASETYMLKKLIASRSGFLLKNPNGTGRAYIKR